MDLTMRLTDAGYKFYPPAAHSLPSCVGLWQKAVDSLYVCRANERLFVNIDLYRREHCGNVYRIAEIGITAELLAGDWADIKLYEVPQDRLAEKLEQLESIVIAAWESAAEKAT